MGKLTIYTSDELHERLVSLAEEQKRSVSAQALVLLEAAMRYQVNTTLYFDPTRPSPTGEEGNSASGIARLAPAPADHKASGRVGAGARKTMCPHRVPAGSFCKHCDGQEAA